MKINPFFTLILLSILVGCGNNELTVEVPPIPNSVEIDIDKDGIEDFIIEYYHGTFLSNFGSERVVGYFTPIGDNQILHKKNIQNLFLKDLNEIAENVNEPLFWNDSGWTEDIVSIHNNVDQEWPDQWEPHYEEEQESYLLGLKLMGENEVKLGWIELGFNLDTGETIVRDSGIL